MYSPQLLQSKSYGEQYYNEHLNAGLDYMGHGKWQEDYGKWVVQSLGLLNKPLLDVGCACGSIACGLAKAGALVSGCDLSEEMIAKGREKWLFSTLKVCDAVNLHYWDDETFDCIHSNQVAEHWKPSLVLHILQELARVTKKGGILWVVLDTEESFAREGRKEGVNEDPTHICIKSLPWWKEQYQSAGWQDAPALMKSLKEHPSSYYKRYNWDSFICTKI
jgi:ubiquinone/menaquinone biosynthesis C-methylase UbiE